MLYLAVMHAHCTHHFHCLLQVTTKRQQFTDKSRAQSRRVNVPRVSLMPKKMDAGLNIFICEQNCYGRQGLKALLEWLTAWYGISCLCSCTSECQLNVDVADFLVQFVPSCYECFQL